MTESMLAALETAKFHTSLEHRFDENGVFYGAKFSLNGNKRVIYSYIPGDQTPEELCETQMSRMRKYAARYDNDAAFRAAEDLWLAENQWGRRVEEAT